MLSSCLIVLLILIKGKLEIAIKMFGRFLYEVSCFSTNEEFVWYYFFVHHYKFSLSHSFLYCCYLGIKLGFVLNTINILNQLFGFQDTLTQARITADHRVNFRLFWCLNINLANFLLFYLIVQCFFSPHFKILLMSKYKHVNIDIRNWYKVDTY